MANTRTIPLDPMERLERLERTQWRADVGVGSFTEPNALASESDHPTLLERLEAIEARLTALERMADG